MLIAHSDMSTSKSSMCMNKTDFTQTIQQTVRHCDLEIYKVNSDIAAYIEHHRIFDMFRI